MYASYQRRHVSIPYVLRWSGRVSGALLFASWVGFVIAELFRDGITLGGMSVHQACALAVVFAGYGIGWQSELAGGLLTLLGTAAFFAVHVLTLAMLPSPAAGWLAAPGALYLLAWMLGYRFGRSKSALKARARHQNEELFFSHLRNRGTRP
jgi:hypothetical protein